MIYRCPKCGSYKFMTSWASSTGLERNQLSAIYCCPSCGKASASNELESFIGRLMKNVSGLLGSIFA